MDVQAARSACSAQIEQAEAQHTFAQQWLTYLEQTPEVLTARLPSFVNLVAATLMGLARDEHFGDGMSGTSARRDFDLLVLEEADQIPEAEFLNAARRARRCVLIGDGAWLEDNAPAPQRQDA